MSDPVTPETTPTEPTKKPTEPAATPPTEKPTEQPATPAAAQESLNLEPAPTPVGRTGNLAIDSVGTLLAESKFPGADTLIENFAETGEISLTDQAKLIKSLGESVGNLAITQLTNEATKLRAANAAQRTEVLNYANEIFKGVDADTTWAQIQEYVKTPESGFTTSDRAAMTEMLAAGGLQAKLVINNIASVYNADANNSTPADLLAGNTLASGASFTPITALDYASELSTLLKTNAYDSPKVQQLQQRRLQSRNQGIA